MTRGRLGEVVMNGKVRRKSLKGERSRREGEMNV